MSSATTDAATAEVQDCFVPTVQAAARALDSQRAVRYGALLQLIDEIQRVRAIQDVADAAAMRWKHCANVVQWRLLCVHRDRAALIEASGHGGATVAELTLADLGPWDAAQWQSQLPSFARGDQLAALRAELPGAFAGARGAELAVLPVRHDDGAIALLDAFSGDAVFDLLDRKFLGHVAAAMAGRIHAIMTEQLLAAELVTAEGQIAEQRHVAMLGRLVNGVAHELNTPLGVQLSACDSLEAALQASVLPPLSELRETVALVGEQARRAARIVRRLKQVSAASRGGMRVPSELMDVIESIAVACTARPDAPEITLVGDETLELEIDRDALGLVLGELIDNAAVHGGRDTGACALTLELTRAENAEVWLDVRDDGPGMDPAIAARYFQPFVTTRQSQGHMGLGGYIVRSLARDALRAEPTLMSSGEAGSGVWIRLVFSLPSSAP